MPPWLSARRFIQKKETKQCVPRASAIRNTSILKKCITRTRFLNDRISLKLFAKILMGQVTSKLLKDTIVEVGLMKGSNIRTTTTLLE